MSNQLSFSVAVHICKVHVFDEVIFLLTIRIPIVTKHFKVVTCCEELSPINMNDILTEWSCWIMWQIKYISTYRRCIETTKGKMLTRGKVPKHDPLIKWPTWDHVTVWKIYISIFMRFIANKLVWLLTLGRIFSMQTLKSSLTSCYS